MNDLHRGFLFVAIAFVAAFTGCSEPLTNAKIDEEPPETPVYVPAPDSTDRIETIRSRIEGKAVGEVHVVNRAFLEAKITRVNSEGVVIQHLNGANLVRWEDLPAELRKEWGYE